MMDCHICKKKILTGQKLRACSGEVVHGKCYDKNICEVLKIPYTGARV